MLTKQYSKKQTLWERKRDFLTIKQGPTQDFREFARILERKGRAYHRNAPEKDIQEALVEAFRKGLSDRTASASLAYAPMATLDEAVGVVSRAMTLRDEPPAKKAKLVQVPLQTQQ